MKRSGQEEIVDSTFKIIDNRPKTASRVVAKIGEEMTHGPRELSPLLDNTDMRKPIHRKLEVTTNPFVPSTSSKSGTLRSTIGWLLLRS
jgi:hypothetical protein